MPDIGLCRASEDTPVNTPEDLSIEMDYAGTSRLIYLGESLVGVASSAAGWRIRKITYDILGNATSILWAGGNDNFDKVWDLRSTYVYS